jgi:hypothetical protein
MKMVLSSQTHPPNPPTGNSALGVPGPNRSMALESNWCVLIPGYPSATICGLLSSIRCTGSCTLYAVFNFQTQNERAAMMEMPAVPPMTGPAIHSLLLFDLEGVEDDEGEMVV